MLFVRRFLLLSAFMASTIPAFSDDKAKVIPAEAATPAIRVSIAKSDDAADDKKKADDEAKKQQAEVDQYQQQFDAQLKKTRAEAEKTATHTVIHDVKLTGKNGNGLQTLAVDHTGRVLALVAPPRGFNQNQKNVTSEIHVLTQDGKSAGVWSVNFHANAVNAGPDGTVYVAGDGKLAKFDAAGKLIGDVLELPFIADMIKDTDQLKLKAEKQIKAEKDSFLSMVKQYKDRVAKLEEKEKAAKEKGEELTKSEMTQLKQNKIIVNNFKETEKFYDSMTVQSVIDGILGRVKVINSISVNDKDVYIVCGESEGYGFGLWRMDLKLTNAKKITSNLSGCCGQMDVQCCGDDIVIAENTKHRFARYDRDGKELATGGKRGKETDPGCFGGCCNPMNVKACGADILTAESEGLIKRFGPTGEFKGIIGAVNVNGGCKNVAIGSTADGSRIFFCDQPGGRVLILAKKDEAKSGD